MAVAISGLAAPSAYAGTSRYYYDPVGRLLGAVQTDGEIRTSGTDAADNIIYLHVFPVNPPSSINVMNPGSVLTADQSINSTDNRFAFFVGEDGALSIQQIGGGAPIWVQSTSSQPGYLVMQVDGNLILYGPNDVALWASNTGGNPGATLTMQTSGNAVVALNGKTLWQSNSGGH